MTLVPSLDPYIPIAVLILVTAFAIWILKDPAVEFLEFFFREAKEFFTLTPSLKSVNFLGLVLFFGIICLFLLPTPLHEIYNLVHPETEDEAAKYIALGTGCFAIFMFFSAFLVCVRLCKGEP